MEVPQFITDVCVANGFDYAEYLGEYKGEQVFAPMFHNPETCFGRPRFLHVKNGKYRWSRSHEEASKVIHFSEF